MKANLWEWRLKPRRIKNIPLYFIIIKYQSLRKQNIYDDNNNKMSFHWFIVYVDTSKCDVFRRHWAMELRSPTCESHSFASRSSSHRECRSSAHHASAQDQSGMASDPGLKLAGPAPGAASGDWCLKQPLTLMISLGFFLSRLLRSYSIRIVFCPICKEGDLLKSFVFVKIIKVFIKFSFKTCLIQNCLFKLFYLLQKTDKLVSILCFE